jgi:hypothetical protein
MSRPLMVVAFPRNHSATSSSQLLIRLKQRIHPIRRVAGERLHNVRVGIHGQADLTVTKRFHDHSWRDALGQ